MAHKPPPAGWPQIQPGLFYRDASAAIDWLCDVFGFEIRLKVEGEPGQIVHSELTYGEGMIMVSGSAKPGETFPAGRDFKRIHTSPLDLDGRVNMAMCMFVDDVDAHCAQARARGAWAPRAPAACGRWRRRVRLRRSSRRCVAADVHADLCSRTRCMNHHWWPSQSSAPYERSLQ